MTETLSHSKSAPPRTTNDRPTLSLGNQDSNLAVNPQILNEQSPPTKPVNQIRTYLIWSIFNLIFIPFGILCCYFSHQVKRFKLQNRYEAAKKWSKRTFVLNIITTLLMVGIIITVTMLHYDYQQNHLNIQGNQTLTTGAFIAWQPGR